MVKVFSMFSGIGGFELGIQQSTMDAELVGYSEINKYAIQIFEERIKGVKNYGDATNIMGDELPEFELLCAGFPCQAFSVAGKRRGFDDTRGTLFFDIARICSEKRPRHLVLENVKGLLSHESGQTFHTILKVLSDMGYDVEWQVLNSKDFGVPQSRERVYIVGHLRGECGRKIFPITGEGSTITRDEIVNVYSVQDTQRINKKQNGTRFKKNNAPSHTLTATDTHGVLFELTRNKPQGQRIYKSENGLSNTLNTSYSLSGIYTMLTEKRTDEGKKIRRERKDKDYTPWNAKQLEPRTDNLVGTLTTSVRDKEHYLLKKNPDFRIRRLTPTEYERLQGFPDGWTEGVSDTQRYKTLGNAVTVNVVEKIMDAIYNE